MSQIQQDLVLLQKNKVKKAEYPSRKWLQSGTVEVGLSSSLTIEAFSPTFGVDSVPVRIEFFALDEDGNVIPNIRRKGSGIIIDTIATITGKIISRSYSPSIQSKNGYMARVTIRPYKSNNDNSLGVDVTVIGN